MQMIVILALAPTLPWDFGFWLKNGAVRIMSGDLIGDFSRLNTGVCDMTKYPQY